MIKCFLSHSSKDKEHYVRIVAKHIRKEAKIFDEETFEEGMSPAEEIFHGLDESSVFVLFLSDSALDSSWVKNELFHAKQYLDKGRIERIFPLIIDNSITYKDSRIPDWLRESTNLQHISRPVVAARKINARLIELAWRFHPRLRERESIFVGRHGLVEEIEERLDDFHKATPCVLIASGLPSIGRKSLLRHSIKKANIVRDSYELPFISLAVHDSIEDFLLKAYDLGLSTKIDLKDSLKGTLSEKIETAKRIAEEFSKEGDRILIEDHGAIVNETGEIVDWFLDIISHIAESQSLTFCIASRLRPNKSINHQNPAFYCLYVDELTTQERNGLLARYARFWDLELRKEDLEFFSQLLTGYPEQAIFAVDFIRNNGVFEAKKSSHEILQYSSEKAKYTLDRYSGNEEALDFIYLLSKFEFLSYSLIFSIVPEDSHAHLLNDLLMNAVCERLGTAGDYIRVNDVIRDYVSRGRFGIPKKYEESVKEHVREYVQNYTDENEDLSDYLFSVQEALLDDGNIAVPDELVIPSILIKTIKKLYDEDRNCVDAIRLCDRVLTQKDYIHERSVQHVRYIKCQCLARQRNRKFFEDVQGVNEPDKLFLFGFYYRYSIYDAENFWR